MKLKNDPRRRYDPQCVYEAIFNGEPRRTSWSALTYDAVIAFCRLPPRGDYIVNYEVRGDQQRRRFELRPNETLALAEILCVNAYERYAPA